MRKMKKLLVGGCLAIMLIAPPFAVKQSEASLHSMIGIVILIHRIVSLQDCLANCGDDPVMSCSRACYYDNGFDFPGELPSPD